MAIAWIFVSCSCICEHESQVYVLFILFLVKYTFLRINSLFARDFLFISPLGNAGEQTGQVAGVAKGQQQQQQLACLAANNTALLAELVELQVIHLCFPCCP